MLCHQGGDTVWGAATAEGVWEVWERDGGESGRKEEWESADDGEG